MLKGKRTLTLDAYELFGVMERVYGISSDTALFAVFGDNTGNGSTAYGDTSRSGKVLDRARLAKHHGTDPTDVLSDLCRLGEVEPGDYTISLSW